jgi:hypothetical protein
VYEDNKITVAFCVNGTRQHTTKHVVIKEFAIHEQIHRFKNRVLIFIPGTAQPAEMLTKALPIPLFENHRQFLGLNSSYCSIQPNSRGMS